MERPIKSGIYRLLINQKNGFKKSKEVHTKPEMEFNSIWNNFNVKIIKANKDNPPIIEKVIPILPVIKWKHFAKAINTG